MKENEFRLESGRRGRRKMVRRINEKQLNNGQMSERTKGGQVGWAWGQ